MILENKDHSIDNVYAYGTDFTEYIYIEDAQRGEKYFCIGCKRPVIARKGKVKRHHYAHKANNDPNVKKCTYSDETYRHKLAKEFLQIENRIKVPSIYKSAPLGSEEKPRLVSPSIFVYPSKILIETYIYEDDNGEIKWTKSSIVENRNLVIKPDAIFFNELNKPILLVEFAATHKINAEKKAKLFRLGINTVQINIPKSSPEDIRQAIITTQKTNWIYHLEHEQANFFQLPSGDNNRISPIDGLNDVIQGENFKCRKSRINNLIRSINRSLQSESYKEIERSFIDEIARIEKNTEHFRKAKESTDEKHRLFEEEIYKRVEDSFSNEDKTERDKYCDLERRYNTKKREIRAEQELLDYEQKRIGNKKDEFVRDKTQTENEQGEIERRIADIGGDIIRERKEIERLQHDILFIPDRIKQLEEEEGREIERIQFDIFNLQNKINQLQESRGNATERNRGKSEETRTETSRSEELIRAEFNERYLKILGEIESRDIGKHGQITSTIFEFYKAMELAELYASIQRNRVTFREGTRAIQEGTWKNWIK